MEKRDFEPKQPLARLLVDELDALLGELVERVANIRDLVSNVVHPGPALGQKLADRRLLAEGREQLDASMANTQRSRLNALVRNLLAMLQAGAEDALIGRHRFVEIVDRHAEVVDTARFHAGDATRG